jgi:transcriptional regulator with XRE-family HTH domain
MVCVAGNDTINSGNPVAHFGKQMRKERVARGWSIHELSAHMGIAAGHLSRIENGKRPPTEKIAVACDETFPERQGWFLEYYEESRTWAPAGFRDWPEYENKAVRLCDWWPSVVSGLLQTEDYARAMLETYPAVSADVVAARLANRMARQQRVLFRDDPPSAHYIIDHAALYRLVGSPEIMAAQMAHLADVASRPSVIMQVLPAVAHPATQSGFLIADSAAYTEHVVGGLVFTDDQTVTALALMFDTLRVECYRASESASIIRKAGAVWTGESRATAARTAELA